MGPDLRTDLPTVASTTRSVLDLAKGMGLTSVAIPLLGTGVGGLNTARVASTMVGVVDGMAREGLCDGMTVLLVAYDTEAAEALGAVVEPLR
jgi:O-acetyl-ADP-ribose deacetylase (regulator of RNase III)